MRYPASFVASALAAVTGIFLILSVVALAPRASKGMPVALAKNYDDCGDRSPILVIRVSPQKLELNGKVATEPQLRELLSSLMQYRVQRLAYIEGDPSASTGEVVHAIEILRDLKIAAALVTPAVFTAPGCIGISYEPVQAQLTADERSRQMAEFREILKPVPWWRLW